LVQRLLSFALDGNVADPVAIVAIRDALDRAGLNPKTAVEIEVKPYQAIFDMEGGSRAGHRGEPQPVEPPTALELPVSDDDGVLDVEVLDADEENWPIPEPPEPFNPFNPFTRTPPPESAMLSLEAAVSVAAETKRNAVARKAIRQ
jgi:hypothetical protein